MVPITPEGAPVQLVHMPKYDGVGDVHVRSDCVPLDGGDQLVSLHRRSPAAAHSDPVLQEKTVLNKGRLPPMPTTSP
jgi:hypothetical protein